MYLLKKWWRDIFLYPRTQFGDKGEYWHERGRHGGTTISAWQKERADFILATVERTPGLTILDIGSGDGGVLNYVRQILTDMKGIGIDEDKEARASLVSADFTALDMDLGSGAVQLPACDYALLCEIIEHVPDAEALLAAARRAARRGVFVSVPNTGFFTYRLRLLFGKFPAQWAVRPNEHLRFWTLTDMRWWLRAQGIHDATVHAYEGVPLLKHLVPNLFAAGIIMYIPTHV